MTDAETRRAHQQVSVTEAAGLFSLLPGGPPDVTLSREGESGYPGVLLRANQEGPFPHQNVYVSLPDGSGLEFVANGLTVGGSENYYIGNLSKDGRVLTFEKVDLTLKEKGSTVTAWVAARATADSLPGNTSLLFCVGDQTSPSTAVHIVDHISFAVTPGVSPVQLTRGGSLGYPGVQLRVGAGTVSAQDVHVALPQGKGLQFAEIGLTVQPAHGEGRFYPGILSEDGQAFTAEGVDLLLSGERATATAWIGVKAPGDAQLGPMYLTFCVGDQASLSSLVQVTDKQGG